MLKQGTALENGKLVGVGGMGESRGRGENRRKLGETAVGRATIWNITKTEGQRGGRQKGLDPQ